MSWAIASGGEVPEFEDMHSGEEGSMAASETKEVKEVKDPSLVFQVLHPCQLVDSPS